MRRLSLAILTLAIACSSEPSQVDSGPSSRPDAACTGCAPDAETAGGEDSGTGGSVDAGPNPLDPANATKDSDCDGLSDAEEFTQSYAGKKTDPANPDSDGDGIPDGVEVGRTSSVAASCTAFKGDADPTTKTIPTVADSDGDGIKDGDEDHNHDGKVDPGETDPLGTDSDGDGILDGVEDKNHDGKRDPGETDAALLDSDGDGISDGVEDLNRNGKVDSFETDPTNANSDGDGCKDGDEDKNHNGRVDPGETDPRVKDCPIKDTDCDGLADNVEDRNGNGVVDPGETDPSKADTDGDGLKDGLELGVTSNPDPVGCPGFVADLDPTTTTSPLSKDADCDGISDGDEDKNHNGKVDTGETDPSRKDTDGDGLLDGLELGVCTNPDPAGCPGFTKDADCGATRTDPLKKDTDNDGIDDGAEDANHNGVVDNGELDPNNPADGTGPAGKACATQNLKAVTFVERVGSDLQIAASPSFVAPVDLTVGATQVGVLLLDPTNKIAGVALRKAPAGSSPSAEETATETLLASVATLTQPLIQVFTTWDGFPAVHATYQLGAETPPGSSVQDDLTERANAIAKKLLPGVTGALTTPAGVKGPFVLEAEYVYRSPRNVVLVLALTPKALWTGGQLFRLADLGEGSAVAQFGDDRNVNCESFVSKSSSAVDFLFVVDDTGSMGPYQEAVKKSADAMAKKLANTTIDWRIAVVTTSYASQFTATDVPNGGLLRGFTRDITEFQSWLDKTNTCDQVTGKCRVRTSQSCGSGSGSQVEADAACKVGVAGDTVERSLLSAKGALTNKCTLGGVCTHGGKSCTSAGGNTDTCGAILPASATEVKGKVRASAQLVIVLVGDADDQDNGTAPGQPIIDSYVAFFKSYDGAGKAALVHGLVCLDQPPAGTPNAQYTACGETQQTLRRNLAVIQATGGVAGAIDDLCEACVVNGLGNKECALQQPVKSCAANGDCAQKCHLSRTTCVANGDADCLQTIEPTISTAVDKSTAGASPYKASRSPIASTLKIAVEGPTLDLPSACPSLDDLPRSRSNGFDFDSTTRRIEFFGGCRPKTIGSRMAISYRYYADTTANPDGNPPPCSTDAAYDAATGKCKQPLSCNRATNKCECPADCGTKDFGVQPPGVKGYVCDQTQCKYVCAPDCGGGCAGNIRCDTASCSCKCDLATSCPAGFKLDPTSCSCRCDVASLPCGSTFQADPQLCACVCKADCGGCPTGQRCQVASCSCTGGPQ